MQTEIWKEVPYVNTGSYVGFTGYHSYLKGIRDGFPQMYGVSRA